MSTSIEDVYTDKGPQSEDSGSSQCMLCSQLQSMHWNLNKAPVEAHTRKIARNIKIAFGQKVDLNICKFSPVISVWNMRFIQCL